MKENSQHKLSNAVHNTTEIRDLMKIEASSLSKRFEYHYVVKDFNFIFNSSHKYGISGPNGSGKSTLMKILSGYLSPSEGSVRYSLQDMEISRSDVYKHISFSAPYVLPAEEFSLQEIYKFHFQFKQSRHRIDYKDFLAILQWKDTGDKYFRNFSSGMKQKVSLALSLLSDTELLLLDEPTSYLDEDAKKWFYNTLAENCSNRTLILASNDRNDFAICEEIIDQQDFCKSKK